MARTADFFAASTSNAPSMSHAHTVNVDDARVAYRVRGSGPTIVLVSGAAGLDLHWGSVIADLSAYRTVVTLDYSGSGDTTDDGRALSLPKLARQVREVARAAGADRFDIVGHSLGAAIAVELAATSPDLVRSLTVVAGFSFGFEPRLRLQFELWLDLLRSQRSAFLRLLLLCGLTPAFISRAGTAVIDEMVRSYLPLANWEGLIRQVELGLAVDIRGQTGRVTSPMLVVQCTHDQIITQTAALAARVPNAVRKQLNTGHLAFLEGADEFVVLLLEFLRLRAVD